MTQQNRARRAAKRRRRVHRSKTSRNRLPAPTSREGAADNILVGGERTSDLISAIAELDLGTPDDDGMIAMTATVGSPVIRALMRIEARLLLEDADLGWPFERTADQRRADAFVQFGRELGRARIAQRAPCG